MAHPSSQHLMERRSGRTHWWIALGVAGLLAACQASGSSPAWRGAEARSLESARRHMVEYAVRQAGITHEGVLDSMLATKRHEFVPSEMQARAYDDAGVPIGEGQTISSPFIVAYMTQSLDPQATDRILEIGTGSGYQAAVLSPLVQDVYSIEIVEPLHQRAAEALAKLGYANVHTKVGDGYLGWEEHAPFDKIIVTCSPEDVPIPLVEQLKEGGMIVVPVGERHQQMLCRMVKQNGELVSTPLRPTLFVPMTGSAEEKRRVLPDASHPALLNGDFEGGLDENQNLRGWYYQRRLSLLEPTDPANGSRYIQFANEVAGQHAHVMQGFAVDGRRVRRVEFRARIACSETEQGARPENVPLAGLTFYDGNRQALTTVVLGPVLGTHDWQDFVLHGILVPETAREAIVRVGLFGATGAVSFDDISVQVIDLAGER